MTLEDILTKLIESLTTLDWKEPKDLLDHANSILYPLKESGELFHYYFSRLKLTTVSQTRNLRFFLE